MPQIVVDLSVWRHEAEAAATLVMGHLSLTVDSDRKASAVFTEHLSFVVL